MGSNGSLSQLVNRRRFLIGTSGAMALFVSGVAGCGGGGGRPNAAELDEFDFADSDNPGLDVPETALSDDSQDADAGRAGKTRTAIAVEPSAIEGQVGSVVAVSATLTAQAPVPGKRIEVFYRNRMIARKTTDAQGRITISLRIRYVGANQLRFKFKGDSKYGSSSTTIRVTGTATPIVLTLEKTEVKQFPGQILLQFWWLATKPDGSPATGVKVIATRRGTPNPAGGTVSTDGRTTSAFGFVPSEYGKTFTFDVETSGNGYIKAVTSVSATLR
jgi:hypothetical protein